MCVTFLCLCCIGSSRYISKSRTARIQSMSFLTECYKFPLKVLLAANKGIIFTKDSKCVLFCFLLYLLGKRLLLPDLLTPTKN